MFFQEVYLFLYFPTLLEMNLTPACPLVPVVFKYTPLALELILSCPRRNGGKNKSWRVRLTLLTVYTKQMTARSPFSRCISECHHDLQELDTRSHSR